MVIIAALRSLIILPWVLSLLIFFPLRISHIFLLFHMLSNFGLDPWDCWYYVVDTLDSTILVQKQFILFVFAGNYLGWTQTENYAFWVTV